MSQPPPWGAVKPYLNESQMRALVAVKNGHRTQQAIADAINRNVWTVRFHIFPVLKQWGLVYYAHGAREWHLSMGWDETLEEIKKRIRWLIDQMCLAIDDFAEPPELVTGDYRDGK